MRKHLVSTLLGLALATAPVLLLAEEAAPDYPACDREPTAADIDGAQGAFKAGKASYAEADYPLAITYWEDAYRRDCTAHELLMNLAQAYQANAQPKRTIKALETFNARNPKDPRVPANERRSVKLREGIERAEAATAPAATTTAPSASSSSTAAPPDDSKPPVGEPKIKDPRPLTPLFVAGGGAVIGLVGGFLYIQGSGDLDDFEATCPDRQCASDADTQAGNDARSKTTLGGVLMAGGGLVAVGGLVWYFLTPKSAGDAALNSPRRGTRIQPTVGKGFTGLSVSGHF